MPTPTTPNQAPKAKRARKKVTTDLGRQLLTRERQRLSREQAALAEQQVQEAMRRQAVSKSNTKVAKNKALDVAISRSIVKRFAGVLASEGVTARITATPSSKTSAWTDFEQIVINYRPQDDERILAATMRGLAYHEGGHCRFTIPFLDLADLAGVSNPDRSLHMAWNCLEDQRMETAVVSDSPRKAAYLTSMVMLDLVPNINTACANWPLLVWRRYLPKRIRTGARKLFVVRHGAAGEALAQDVERVTNDYVMADNAADMWAAVVEYHGLLGRMQPMAAGLDDGSMGHQRQYKRNERNLDDYLVIPVDGEMVDDGNGGGGIDIDGDDDIDLTDPEVARHLAEVLSKLFLEPETLIPVIYATQSKGQEGDGEGGQGEKSDVPKPGTSGESDESGDDEGEGDESDEDADGNGGGDSDEDADDEGQGEAGDDAGKKFANDAADDQSDKGGSSGAHKNTGVRDDLDYKPEDDEVAGGDADDESDDEGDADLTDEDLADALAEAEAERDSDHNLDQDVQALHEAINDKTSELVPYNGGISNDAEAKAAADNLAQDIEQAFQEATIDKAPGWVEQQRRGIVNVLRYETRRPGEVEFFRQYTDTDAPGMNISVSVLLDYSSSMSGATKELAQAGYACKVACDNLAIPCTVVLWDTDATILWDTNERAEHLPVIVANGGTDPSNALADLDNQRYDKDTHVVIIMTDGAWGGSAANGGFLASYNGERPGRYFIGLGYSDGQWGENAHQIAENLRRYGCDESHGIENLMDIPRFLEQALIAFS